MNKLEFSVDIDNFKDFEFDLFKKEYSEKPDFDSIEAHVQDKEYTYNVVYNDFLKKWVIIT